jgi:hypothetical protein
MFMGKARSLGWKSLPGTDALAYFKNSTLTAIFFYNIGHCTINITIVNYTARVVIYDLSVIPIL